MSDLVLKKGYNIRLEGEAPSEFISCDAPTMFAIKPTDFPGLKPKLLVAVGDEVKVGSPLFHEKGKETLLFTSPVAGKVFAINRGARRKILSVVIEDNGTGEHHQIQSYTKDGADMNREEVLAALLESGLFPLITRRPFARVADPDHLPRDIFITLADTAPLAPRANLLMNGNEEAMVAGINALAKLTDGTVHATVAAADRGLVDAIKSAQCQINTVTGPHPAGNVGMHIANIAPIKGRNDVVWATGLQELIRIGRFFQTGKIDHSVIVAVAGSNAVKRGYVKTLAGAPIASVVGAEYGPESRIISGNVLTGAQESMDGFVGIKDSLVTIIPEATEPNFFLIDGWAGPGFGAESYWRMFMGKLLAPVKGYVKDTRLGGGARNFISTGAYESVVPMDIYPNYLIKSIMYKDIEEMEGLGIYEVAEEDFALCEYICPSKIEFQSLLRQGLDYVETEG
jgi:Na+-transporting NADH:ubiquinone oxidoreductase subunit A